MRLLTLLSLAASVLAGSRTSAPSGSIVVAKSGGTYSTINQAISALSTTTTSTQTIFIKAGTYDEQVYIPKLAGELIIYGQTADDTSYSSNTVTITHGISLATASNDDNTATLRNYAAKSRIYNINVKNTYGQGHQALALSAYNTEQGYYGCQFIGFQDTVLAETGYQVYAKCYIEGAVDFIFGQTGNAWFHDCDIGLVTYSTGTITAQGRPSSSSSGYFVINGGTVKAAPGHTVAAGSYALGRPWTEYARVVFQKTNLSAAIKSAGWDVWSSSSPNTADVLFGEYSNTGSGASGTRASFAKKLSSAVSISSILGSGYTSWVDTSYLS
ncbi:Pectinesterase [Penicillium oxalicum]|uniref:Pectinesterase n=1 Tax=Penicillium oxalicum (strain 114-2 / CGMCC 5302) TaxID=933388 RepID=S8AXD6_PENO1|nr:Pectinesterase [Penicillium oxalicum]EPS26592.1 putative pectin methylesterase [Penicillium oxalicum 114-2]KAI2786714.1 Pectinesterase [Penicillium oxalicum]